MDFHHVALGAHDVESVATFYRTMFDLPEDRRHHEDDGTLRSIWLRAGSVLLMVEKSTDREHFVKTIGHGPFLLAFSVSETEREALELRLEQNGHRIEARTAHTSYARDPEGNRVAFSHFPS
jgi:catechol 2,3-dioxygenase-like lactoylglutathione lyase family enzyme